MLEKSFFALNKFELWFIKTREADESFHGAKALTTCRRVNCDKNRLGQKKGRRFVSVWGNNNADMDVERQQKDKKSLKRGKTIGRCASSQPKKHGKTCGLKMRRVTATGVDGCVWGGEKRARGRLKKSRARDE
ncbi:hypothetical protein RUM43_006941 [Polyplax serrata]|uniref:Uncharacterized protein n=1 Tax=Polyplax serrata TaxID=468196 RepID=A0AAN8S8G6_POLSC